MAIEIERKFLVNKEEWSKVKSTGISYQQGYLLRDANKTIRVRISEAGEAYITIKGETTGYSRPEYEYPVPLADAEEMLQHFCEAIISKTRYKITVFGKLWEVDEFHGDNEGLLLAELELASEDEAFELPDWISDEVTQDHRYYNSWLSAHPYNTWNE